MTFAFCRGVCVGLWAGVVLLFLATLARGAHVSTCRVVVGTGGGVSSVGSGAKVSEDESYDYVLTAAHVVTERGQVYPHAVCEYPAGRVSGRVIGYDRQADVAVIRTKKTSIPFFPMAEAQIGETVWCEGMVSNTRTSKLLNRRWGMSGEFAGGAISGDSGGPIRNTHGHVVGVIWGSSGGTTMACETATIVRRIPTPVRNFLRIVTAHPPVQAYAGAPYCAPGQCAPQIQQPRQPPAPYIEPTEPAISSVGIPGPRGPEGKQGPAGPQGPPGKDAEVNYERIIAAVVAEIPHLDIDAVTQDVVARLPPIQVETYDQGRKLLEAKSYAYPGPIKIQYFRIDVDEIAGKVAERLK